MMYFFFFLLLFIENIRYVILEKHVFEFDPYKKNDTLDLKGNDTIEYLCKNEKNDNFNIYDEYKKQIFCFENVLLENGTAENTEDYIRGVYDIKTEERNDGVIVKSMTLPPVVMFAREIRCYCYMSSNVTDDKKKGKKGKKGPNGSNVEYKRKVLYINIERSMENPILGCDFNEHHKQVNAVNTIQHLDRKNNKVCNINVQGEQNIVLFCPENYTIEPDNCFENAFKYLNDSAINKQQLSKDDITLISLENETGLKLTGIYGSTKLKYAKINETTVKALFMCYCVNANNTDILRINVFLNVTIEEVKASGIGIGKPKPYIPKDPRYPNDLNYPNDPNDPNDSNDPNNSNQPTKPTKPNSSTINSFFFLRLIFNF